MQGNLTGPIEHFSWGKFIIQGHEHSEGEFGKIGVGKDIRMIGETVSEWRERKGHELKESMITGVFHQGIDVLIIGNGVSSALQCPRAVVQWIQSQGIGQVLILPTPDACRKYNQLFHEQVRAALLAHGTC